MAKKARAWTGLVVAVVVMWGAWAGAYTPKVLEIGAQAPAFELPGVDGKVYRLKDFDSARVLVVIFTCNHCPTAQAYEGRIMKMQEEYKGKGVAVVAISPNDPLAVRLDELGYTDLNDSLEEMKLRAKEKGFAFPYLYDGEKQEAAKAYGALATPHVFVFDQERKLRYTGRIDDGEVRPVKSHDARNAIEALLAGRKVEVETTKVFGCSTKWSDKREDAKKALARWEAEAVELKEIDEGKVKALVRNDSKKLRLINVWASWCGPCVNEMPELVEINRMYRGREFEMVTISIDALDRKDKALEALKRLHVSSVNYIFTGEDRDKLAEALDKEWPGPVPYTMLVEPGGKVIWRKAEPVEGLELKRAIVGWLGRTY